MNNSTTNSKELNALTWMIRLFCLLRIPLLAFCWPKIERIDSQVAEVSLPLNFLTRNHVRSMYFGALAMGAELSTAIRLLQRMKNEKLPLGFIFKDASFEFLKRAESHVVFHIEQVSAVDDLIKTALASEARVDKTISGWAYSRKNPNEILMKYSVTLSIKKSKRGLF
jgi:Domain of unknown function (DUF4442)